VIVNSRNRVESHRFSSFKEQNVNFSSDKSSNKLHSNWRHDLAMYIQDSFINELTQSELNVYLEERNVSVLEDDNFDILAWWKSNTPKYLVFSSLVWDILGTPASTVALESIFSTSGRILNDYKNSLSRYVVEVLICTQNKLRAFARDNVLKCGFFHICGEPLQIAYVGCGHICRFLYIFIENI
jgi:hAT family C-terminal dimerisation region